MKKFTEEQFKEMYGEEVANEMKVNLQPSGFSDFAGDIKGIGTDIKRSFQERQENIGESIGGMRSGDQGLFRTTAQALGQGAGLASDVIGAGVKGGIKSVLEQKTEDKIKDEIKSAGEYIVSTDAVKKIMESYDNLTPEVKRDLSAAFGVVSLAADLVGGSLGTKGVKAGTEITTKGVKAVASGVEDITKQGLKIAEEGTRSIRNVAGMVAEEAATIPKRISTNIAEKQLVREVVEKLPSEVAKTAARNGVDISDIKYLYSVPKTQKETIKTLFKAVKDFSSGASKTNPIEIVGKPIITRIKNLEATLSNVGKKLGEVSNNLGKVSTEEIFPQVFNTLKKVPGLSGLRVSKNGILDFSETVLATAETLADRKAIQRIFLEAIKSGTGKQKHLLRQELFEVLGGKKMANLAITGTQERAYEAIRSGLSTVLESKNSLYKTLSAEYRKILTPLKDMRKFMKNVAGADEDILEMSAGLLARRLTSNAASNPQIKAILRAMDNATKVPGKTSLSIETLQDAYNILNRYYDIAGRTGLQGQISSGIESSRGVGEFIAGQVRSMAGQTDAVKRKAIEDILNDILK